MIALNERPALEQTLELFAAGVDDVVRKPIHVREILARVSAIRRRLGDERGGSVVGEIEVFPDGRDPLGARGGACRCRAASAASWNISSPTAAGG